MVNEKVVIVLLLITIILSIFSVIMALGADNSAKVKERTKEIVTVNPPSAGNIQLIVKSPGVSG